MTRRARSMSMFRATLAATLLLAGLASVVAQQPDPPYSGELGRCIDEAGGATFPTMECIGREHEAWDGRLNAAYRAALDKLEDARKTAMRDAQRAWLTFRERNCGFHADPEGGSLARLDGAFCMLRMTAWRALELEAIVKELDIR